MLEGVVREVLLGQCDRGLSGGGADGLCMGETWVSERPNWSCANGAVKTQSEVLS